MARAIFGDVGLSLFVAGAAFPDILIALRSGGCEMTISWSDHGRVMVG